MDRNTEEPVNDRVEPVVRVDDIIRTSYTRQPLVVVDVIGGCRCPEYRVEIDCDGSPCNNELDCGGNCPLTRSDPPHLHLVCVEKERFFSDRWRACDRRFYGGYVPDGAARLRCIWNDGLTPGGEPDVIEIVGHVPGSQLTLFD